MPSRHTYALAGLVLVMVVWGSTYVVTKAAVREIPPEWRGIPRLSIVVSIDGLQAPDAVTADLRAHVEGAGRKEAERARA